MSRKLIVWLVVPALAIIVVLLLAGYGMGVRATESRVAAAEITQGSSTVTSGEPVIAVTPLSGGPGTLIAVTGANFPAGATITIQLAGQAAPSPVQTYAVTQAGPSGNFSISFVMPANWPDGTAIPSQTLTVVATRAGSDGTRASAAFGYSSGSTPVAAPADAAATLYAVAYDSQGKSTRSPNTIVTVVGANTATPTPTNTPAPTQTPVPTGTPAPTQTPAPAQTPAPTGTPAPTQTSVPTGTLAPATAIPVPTATVQPTATATATVASTPSPKHPGR